MRSSPRRRRAIRSRGIWSPVRWTTCTAAGRAAAPGGGRQCQFRAPAHPGRCLRGARLSRRAGVRLVRGRGDRPGDLGRARARARLAARAGPARAARRGGRPVLGFASRALVGQARAQGASACLELPYDLLDLGHVLARVTAPLGEPAHAVPPRPASARRRAPAAARKNQNPDRPPVAGPGPGA